MSILSRIILLSVSLVLITSGIISIYSYSQSSEAAKERLNESVKAEVKMKVVSISHNLKTLQDDVIFLSRLTAINRIVRAREAGGIDPQSGESEVDSRIHLVEMFRAFLSSQPEYFQIRFVGVDDLGREIVRVEGNAGLIKVSSEGELQQKGHRPYFKQSITLKKDEVLLSDLNLNQEHGHVAIPYIPTMRASTPIFDMYGHVFGFVIINKNMTSMLEMISEIDFKGDSDYLLNSSGDILASQIPSQNFGFNLDLRHQIQEAYPETISLFTTTDLNYGFIDLADKGLLAYFEKIYFDPRDASRFLMLLDIHAPIHKESSLRSILETQLFLYLLLTLASVGLAIVLARRIAAPLIQLSHAAKEIGEGSTSVNLPSPNGSEEARLTKAFSLMLQRLAENKKSLYEKIGELEVAHIELETMASTDGLTGIYNRRTFNERLEDECTRADRYVTHLSLMMIDLDLFKEINDTHGHQVGDRCLVLMAECINQTIRDSDIAARYGGEEFTVILPQTMPDAALILAERLREKAATSSTDSNFPSFTISIGVATYRAGISMTSEMFLKEADDALYQAKENGRNQVILGYTEKLTD